MTKKIVRFAVRDEFIDELNPKRNQISQTRVDFTHAESIAAQCIHAIENNQAQALQQLLDQPFIYAGDGQWVSLTDDGSYDYETEKYYSSYKGHHHIRNITYEYYYTRPLLEALFLEHPNIFRSIITAAARSNCDSIHTCLVNRLQDNSLFPKNLCHAVDIPCLEARIEALDEYGYSLMVYHPYRVEKSQHIRGIQARALAQDLKTFSANYLPSAKIANPHTIAIQWLDFKLRFVDTLHQYDHHFITHHGSKCLLVNIATVIFSAAVLNILNYAITGNFLFFKKTTTASLIDTIDQTIQVPVCSKA